MTIFYKSIFEIILLIISYNLKNVQYVQYLTMLNSQSVSAFVYFDLKKKYL